MSESIVLRIRTQLGTWRLQNVTQDDSLFDLRRRIESEHKTDLNDKLFTSDISGKNILLDDMTVRDLCLKNGDMIYIQVDESKTSHELASVATKRIQKDGTIVTQEYSHIVNKKGFRPGMMSLRSMKMAWTLNEFVALDEQFQFKIKRQTESICKKAIVNKKVIEDFQGYMMNFDYRKIRIGYLYGYVNDDNSVKIEVIYEPPQDNTDISFHLLEDNLSETVEYLTKVLGMRKVGWIFSHPTRETGFHFSNVEIIYSAEQQMESVGGLDDTTFVTIKVTINEKNEMEAEAYQISKQCVEMVAEGALQVSKDLGMSEVNDTFTAYVEGKPTKQIDNDFFLIPVPITHFESDVFVSFFPRANREGVCQSSDDLKKQLQKVGKEGWSMQALLSDFHLLLFISQYFNLTEDIPIICESVLNKEVKLTEGHELILRSLAGL